MNTKIRFFKTMKELLNTNNETQVFNDLLPYYSEKRKISKSEKELLLNYHAINYSLLGLIGLLTIDMPRILLGKVSYDQQIIDWCNQIKHTLKDLEDIADIYLEVEQSEAELYVFEQVMLKYPRHKVDDDGKLIK